MHVKNIHKYAWVVTLKCKNDITVTNAFQKTLSESNRKLKNIWADKGSEFYKRSMKSLLLNNDTIMYSIHNEEKSVVTERLIRTLKNKICKYVTSVFKNVYLDKLGDLVNKYNNKYHSTIKMKPLHRNSSTYIDFGIENSKKHPKFEVV